MLRSWQVPSPLVSHSARVYKSVQSQARASGAFLARYFFLRAAVFLCEAKCLRASLRGPLCGFPDARSGVSCGAGCGDFVHPSSLSRADAMSSPSSGEQYEEEEDGAYESQAKRLKPSVAAEEGEIEYGAEESESHREKAAPRGGGFSGGVRWWLGGGGFYSPASRGMRVQSDPGHVYSRVSRAVQGGLLMLVCA